jgi:hypothetical protein
MKRYLQVCKQFITNASAELNVNVKNSKLVWQRPLLCNAVNARRCIVHAKQDNVQVIMKGTLRHNYARDSQAYGSIRIK